MAGGCAIRAPLAAVLHHVHQLKTRRDQRRRQEKQAANKAAAQASPVEPHAELRDAQRTLLAGVVRRDGEWVLGMDVSIAGHSDSAAQVLALIMQAGELHEAQRHAGAPDVLRCAARRRARRSEKKGQTFEEFKAELAAAMAAKKDS